MGTAESTSWRGGGGEGGSEFDYEIFINAYSTCVVHTTRTTYAPGFRNWLELLEHASRYLRGYTYVSYLVWRVVGEGRGKGIITGV